MILVSESAEEAVFQLDSGVRFRVSPEDKLLVLSHSWQLNKGTVREYIRATDGRLSGQYLHRLICPSGNDTDHIDHDTMNNRQDNLRPATQSQNQHNSVKSKANTSGHKGVSFDKRRNKFKARLCVNGKEMWLGYFITLEAAATARTVAATQFHGEFANHG